MRTTIYRLLAATALTLIFHFLVKLDFNTSVLLGFVITWAVEPWANKQP